LAADGYLNFDTKIDTKGFSKGLGTIENSLGSLKTMLLSVAGAVGIAFGIKDLIETAANVNAANSQLEQTFKELKSTAVDAMRRVANESGIFETRLHGIGTSIYAFAKASGMDSVQALGMMEDALRVTADSAAYYDRSLEDTAESLKSFLKGNFENDAALGLSCTETTRNTAANKMYARSFKELSEAQKQVVLLQMVRDANALSGAEGQAAREAEGWENVIGNLRETWRQLLAVVGQPVLKAATSFVKGLTSALAKLTVWAQAAYNSLAGFFGWEPIKNDSVSAASDIASAISSSVDEQNQFTDAVNETAKAQENSLAGFDKINKLSSSDSSGGGSGGGGGGGGSVPINAELSPVTSDVSNLAKEIKDVFNGMLDPIFQAWNDHGKAFIDSFLHAIKGIKDTVKSIGESFAEVWKNGTGYEVCSSILKILTNIFNTIGNIESRFAEAWSQGSGTSIIQGYLDLFLIFLGVIERCTAATAEWSESLDFSPILSSFSGFLESVKPLAENFGDLLVWLYKKVLLPIASWVIEDAAPASLDVFSGAIDVLNEIIEALKPLGKWLWEKFLEPIGKWTGGVIVSVLEGVSGALRKLSDWISKHKTAVQDLTLVIGALGASFAIAGKINALSQAFSSAGGIISILKGAVSGLSGAFSLLTSPIGLIAAGISAVIAVGALLIKHWDEIKAFASETWENIKEIFSPAAEFFANLWNSIKLVFTPAFEYFKNLFSNISKTAVDIWNSITEFIGECWNTIQRIFQPAAEHFSVIFSNVWNNIKYAFSKAGEFFSDTWSSIKKPFINVTDWFREKFSSAWQAVKDVFSSGGRIF